MVNLLCGLAGMVLLSLFIGGLAHSIWVNTGSLAFPIIVGLVLIMAYVEFGESVKDGFKKRGRD